jgi:hypothetical protein
MLVLNLNNSSSLCGWLAKQKARGGQPATGLVKMMGEI